MILNLTVSFRPCLHTLSDIVIRYSNQNFPFLRASPWLLSTQFIYDYLNKMSVTETTRSILIHCSLNSTLAQLKDCIFFRGSFRKKPCALRSTQPLKISTRDFSWGKGGRCVRLTTYHPCSAEVEKIRGLNLPGTPRATSACRGIPLHLHPTIPAQ